MNTNDWELKIRRISGLWLCAPRFHHKHSKKKQWSEENQSVETATSKEQSPVSGASANRMSTGWTANAYGGSSWSDPSLSLSTVISVSILQCDCKSFIATAVVCDDASSYLSCSWSILFSTADSSSAIADIMCVDEGKCNGLYPSKR